MGGVSCVLGWWGEAHVWRWAIVGGAIQAHQRAQLQPGEPRSCSVSSSHRVHLPPTLLFPVVSPCRTVLPHPPLCLQTGTADARRTIPHGTSPRSARLTWPTWPLAGTTPSGCWCTGPSSSRSRARFPSSVRPPDTPLTDGVEDSARTHARTHTPPTHTRHHHHHKPPQTTTSPSLSAFANRHIKTVCASGRVSGSDRTGGWATTAAHARPAVCTAHRPRSISDLARIAQLVGWAEARDVAVLIDFHQDNYANLSSWYVPPCPPNQSIGAMFLFITCCS